MSECNSVSRDQTEYTHTHTHTHTRLTRTHTPADVRFVTVRCAAALQTGCLSHVRALSLVPVRIALLESHSSSVHAGTWKIDRNVRDKLLELQDLCQTHSLTTTPSFQWNISMRQAVFRRIQQLVTVTRCLFFALK